MTIRTSPEGVGERAGAEQPVPLRPGLAGEDRRDVAAASAAPWTSGDRLLGTSIGNHRFGVVMNARRPTLERLSDEAALLSSPPTCSITAFEDDVELPSSNGSASAFPCT